MRYRALGRTLLVCCLVVLAGCGGTAWPNTTAEADPTATVTPVPVPTADDRYPPGVSARGVAPEVIATTMRTELRNTAFTWTLEERGTFDANSTSTDYVGSRIHAEVAGPVRYSIDQRLLAADPGENTLLSATYVNGSRVLVYDGDSVTTRPVASAQQGYPSRVAATFTEYLRAQRVYTTVLENGSVLVEGTGSSRLGYSNYTVTALIGSDGIIHRIDAGFTTDGRSATVRFRLERDTAFEPPAWVAMANGTVTR
jgi:hypothetical protein